MDGYHQGMERFTGGVHLAHNLTLTLVLVFFDINVIWSFGFLVLGWRFALSKNWIDIVCDESCNRLSVKLGCCGALSFYGLD